MTDITETFEHNGHTVTIEPDYQCENPLDHPDFKVAILHGRYVNPSPECGTTPEEIEAWQEENKRDYWTANLWLYDHGQVAYLAGETNPFSCPRDSGRVGIIAIPRGRGFGPLESGTPYLETANIFLETYTNWANGQCCGWYAKNDDGETIDSCWGFYSLEEAIDDAEAALA